MFRQHCVRSVVLISPLPLSPLPSISTPIILSLMYCHLPLLDKYLKLWQFRKKFLHRLLQEQNGPLRRKSMNYQLVSRLWRNATAWHSVITTETGCILLMTHSTLLRATPHMPLHLVRLFPINSNADLLQCHWFSPKSYFLSQSSPSTVTVKTRFCNFFLYTTYSRKSDCLFSSLRKGWAA